jgi:hypothetical protein
MEHIVLPERVSRQALGNYVVCGGKRYTVPYALFKTLFKTLTLTDPDLRLGKLLVSCAGNGSGTELKRQ